MSNDKKKSFKGSDKVREVMTTDVDMVSPSTKIGEAARQMRDMNVGSLPVVDRQELVGIVTDRDITIRVTADGVNPDEVLVKEVMTAGPVTVRPDQTLDEASEMMSQHQVRRLPVVEKGKLVGMLALGDVATEPGSQDEAGSALTDISQPSDMDRSIQAEGQA
ncbi:MAG: putative signal transduction protein with domain [Chloroflexi bacterium]|nr:putative signal transduction protein with domain [Chloroflexota bacterium]